MKTGLKYKKRLVFLSLFIFTLFSLLIAQFYKIQIYEGDKWTKVAKRQHFYAVHEPFLRGTFFANTSIKKGHPELPERFVVDIQKFHLYIDPLGIPANFRKPIADQLIKILDIKKDDSQRVRQQFRKHSRSRKIAMWLDSDIKDRIKEWWFPFARKNKIPKNAVFFFPDYQRSYPFGKLLGPVLHTVQSQRNPETGQAIPTGGLELYYDSYLQGKRGKRVLKRSPRHSFETGKVIESSENGADIHLTINHILQAIAEEEIALGVQNANAKGGWAVMMDPKTGHILALAQYPFFHPSDYPKYYQDNDLIEQTKVKAVTDAFEPGSIMKPITLATAITANEVLEKHGESPIFDPEEKIGTLDGAFPGRRPLRDIRPHKFLNMYMGLQKSSNIYMARLIERVVNRLGDFWYRGCLQDRFCFGKKTGVELPAETQGVLPTPGKVHPNGKLEWSKPTPFSLAMGHNIQVNSIQLIRAFSLFANGGYLVDPTVVKKVVKTHADGKKVVLVDNTARGIKDFPQVLSEAVVKKVVKAMKFVTKYGGSGRRADIWGYTEAGKTGTANKIVDGVYSQSQYIADFIGFAPVSDPAFVLLIVIDEPEKRYETGVGYTHFGGVAAAPVFRAIATRTLEYLGIEPDDPLGYPAGDPRAERSKADWIKENRELQEKYEKWNNGSG